MEEEKLLKLIREYITGDASQEQLAELSGYISKDENAESISAALEKVLAATGAKDIYDQDRFDPLLKNILNADKTKNKIFKLYPLTRWIAAAAIIIFVVGAGYFYFNKVTLSSSKGTLGKVEGKAKNDIAPGGNKAILTLSNGTQIVLDSMANGTISSQGNTKIIKLDSGRLAYQAVTLSKFTPSKVEGSKGVEGYNTITTPRGGQYQIVLADGSKVWLNAASSLKYPTAFTGKERNVELTGEGYFEVAHDATKPFKVSVNGIDVQVLGTHFNINAYNDESVIKTTLLEGSVKVTKGSASKVIKPGEQAILRQAQGDNDIKIAIADVDEAVAWKNGRFIFEGNNIRSVMRQLARWYDVDVTYQGSVTDEEFVGVINRSRYENISQVLHMLEKTRTVRFAINGHRITVMPYQ